MSADAVAAAPTEIGASVGARHATAADTIAVAHSSAAKSSTSGELDPVRAATTMATAHPATSTAAVSTPRSVRLVASVVGDDASVGAAGSSAA